VTLPARVFRFRTTAKASADARALAHIGLARLDLIIDAVAVVVAFVMMAAGYLVFGLVILVVAGVSLAGTRFRPLQRAIISIRFRSMLGQATEVSVDDAGLTFTNQLATSHVPWSSINVVRSNSETVAFFRDRLLMGYIPADAFESAEAKADLIEFATMRLGAPAVL